MSGYRGALIFPQLVELRRLDLAATAALDPDGAGPLTTGFDPDFREPASIVTSNGQSARQEMAPILVPCQVEEETADELQQRVAGNDPLAKMRFVFHYADLEAMGLVDANGTAQIKVNDRATAIYTMDETLIQRLDALDGRGLYCVSITPGSYGLSSGLRNIVVATFTRRMSTL